LERFQDSFRNQAIVVYADNTENMRSTTPNSSIAFSVELRIIVAQVAGLGREFTCRSQLGRFHHPHPHPRPLGGPPPFYRLMFNKRLL
jgi:hypothetical protein